MGMLPKLLRNVCPDQGRPFLLVTAEMVGVFCFPVFVEYLSESVGGDQLEGAVCVVDPDSPVVIVKAGIDRCDYDNQRIGKLDLGQVTQKIGGSLGRNTVGGGFRFDEIAVHGIDLAQIVQLNGSDHIRIYFKSPVSGNDDAARKHDHNENDGQDECCDFFHGMIPPYVFLVLMIT